MIAAAVRRAGSYIELGLKYSVGEERRHRLGDFRRDLGRGIIVGVNDSHRRLLPVQTSITRMRSSTRSFRFCSTSMRRVWLAPAQPWQDPASRQ